MKNKGSVIDEDRKRSEARKTTIALSGLFLSSCFSPGLSESSHSALTSHMTTSKAFPIASSCEASSQEDAVVTVCIRKVLSFENELVKKKNSSEILLLQEKANFDRPLCSPVPFPTPPRVRSPPLLRLRDTPETTYRNTHTTRARCAAAQRRRWTRRGPVFFREREEKWASGSGNIPVENKEIGDLKCALVLTLNPAGKPGRDAATPRSHFPRLAMDKAHMKRRKTFAEFKLSERQRRRGQSKRD